MWQGLEELIQLVEQGSFTAAARKLDVSTSHVSRRIHELEQRLGVVLVKRSTRKISLTDAGRQYVNRVLHIRQELFDANTQLQGTQLTPKGLIRLTGAGEFVARQVAPALASFIEQYPEVSIDLDFSNRNVDLIEEGFDLAIRFGRMQDSNLIARPLINRRMTLVATEQYIEQYGQPTSPEQLAEHNCLIAVTNRWRFLIDGQVQEIKVGGNWRSNNGSAILAACFQSLGIAHLAYDLVERYLAEGKLISLLPDYQVTDNATWLIYPRKDLMPLRVRLLIDYLLAYFRSA